MNPPSHLLVNAVLRRAGMARLDIPAWPFLLGSVAPDAPLTLMTIMTALYHQFVVHDDLRSAMRQAFEVWYFRDPLWIASYNVLHSPLLLGIYLALLWTYRHSTGSRRRWLFWFAAGCLVHACLDILTHVDDGPLLLYPLNWTLRFHSPVSYWDPRYHGREFGGFEVILDVALLVILLAPAIRRRVSARRAESEGPLQ